MTNQEILTKAIEMREEANKRVKHFHEMNLDMDQHAMGYWHALEDLLEGYEQ